MGFFTNSVQAILFPVGQFFHSQSVALSPKTTALQQENTTLRKQLADMNGLRADNAALRDQFQTANPVSNTLLPVHVVGMGDAIPNMSFPQRLVIHAGKKEGITVGNIVVVKNEAVGDIVMVSDHFSVVRLVSSKESSFAAVTSATGAIGVAKGSGSGDITLDNVLLSQQLQVGDMVVTKGSQDISGKGFPEGLIIGKITSIDKNPSSLFQKARVVPLTSFDHLSMVFVIRSL